MHGRGQGVSHTRHTILSMTPHQSQHEQFESNFPLVLFFDSVNPTKRGLCHVHQHLHQNTFVVQSRQTEHTAHVAVAGGVEQRR